MKNFFWHYEITNTRSDTKFRTIENGATKEGADKRAKKHFPAPIYNHKLLGNPTKFLKDDCDISLLNTTYK